MLTNSNNFIQTFEIHVKNIEKKPKKYRNKKDTKFKERKLSNAKKPQICKNIFPEIQTAVY